MYLEELSNLEEKLQIPQQSILILSHKNPDGDAIGSSLGWADYLSLRGHQVKLIMPNDFPDFLKWIPKSNEILLADNLGKDGFIDQCKKADLVFALDFNHLSRIAYGEELENFKEKLVMIDHHEDPQGFGTINISQPSACATAEMIIDVIQYLENDLVLSPDGATALYVGLLTDSGSFRFPSTTANTFRSAADLIELGADNSKIYEQIFDTSTKSRLKLLGFALNDKLTFYPEKKAALIALSSAELKQFNFQKGDSEGFVNYPLSVNDVQFSVLLKEDGDIVKVSLRSKGDFAVNELSAKYFSGGGHKNASGGKFDGTLDEAIKQFEKLLNEV